MAKQYILRRIIPRSKCPGTCCKVTGAFPDASGHCVHFQQSIGERPLGGCPFFKSDNSVDTSTLKILSKDEQKQFMIKCVNWPVPQPIPELNVPYDNIFGRQFGEACPCFKWEIKEDFNNNINLFIFGTEG